MALQVEIQVPSFTQLQHSGKGAAVQLKDVQQSHHSGMSAFEIAVLQHSTAYCSAAHTAMR